MYLRTTRYEEMKVERKKTIMTLLTLQQQVTNFALNDQGKNISR